MKKRTLILATMIATMTAFAGCGKKTPEEKLADELKSTLINFDNSKKEESTIVNSDSSKEEESAIDPQAYRTGYTYENGVLSLYMDQGNYNFFQENYGLLEEVTEVIITGRSENVGSLSKYKNLEKVTIKKDLEKIGRQTFTNCEKIETLVLPDSVKTIEEDAFAHCTSLKNINMPKSLTYIGRNAFFGCSSLENVTFPDSLTAIGESAFARCTSLTKVCIPKNVYVFQDGFLCCSSVTELILEDGMRGIGSSFMDATFGGLAITEVTIPGSVETIGDRAFCYTNTLETVVIKEGVKNIGKDAFIVCPLLTSVTIPASVESIYENPFGGCSEDFTIYGVAGSAAETCANTYGYRFVAQ